MQFNLADLFESIVGLIGERTAIVSGEHSVTWAELEERANRLANWWLSQGIGPGDHVGLYLYNGAPYLEAMLAAFKIRAVPININYRYVAHELAYLFDNADLKGLVFRREFASMVVEAAQSVPDMTVLLSVDDGSGAATDAPDYEAMLALASPERNFGPRSGDDLYVVYTGGTTGMPRGVMWEHKHLLFAALQGGNPGDEPLERPEQLAEMVESGDRFPFTMHPAPPLIHGAAQLASWITLLTGGKVVLVPERGFNAKRSAELIEREEVMVVNLVGDAMARPFAEVEHDHDLECLAVVQSAGAILSPSVREALVARFPEAMILNNLGASETGHQGTALDDGKPGRAVFETTDNNAVFDDELRRCGVGELGKLARRGHIPLGYYGDPEKTARTFFDIEGERWVIPGDYAMLTEQGTIVLLGRGAVCINTGGEKVFPEEVEEILKGDPGVMDALVVGLPDDRWGERVAAVVQKRDGSVRTSDEIDAHVRTKLAGYKAPRAYFFVEEVRRQPSGKPDYAWAKETAVRMAGA